MNLSEPTLRFLKVHPEYQKVIESFSASDKATFQKLCEDLQLAEKDQITIDYKKEVREKIQVMLSEQYQEKQKQEKKDWDIIGRFSKLNRKDVETIKDLQKLTGKDYLDMGD